MSGATAGKFQDHYQTLGIDPKSEPDLIHRAYSQLAKKYHAGSKETANQEKYSAVTLAYEVLSDPVSRRSFDALRSGPAPDNAPQFSGNAFFLSIASEGLRRQCLLCILYDRRRRKPATPGLSMRQIESMIASTPEELRFSLWYLKQRGFAASDDKSNVEITFQGIDYIERDLPRVEDMLVLLKPGCLEEAGLAAMAPAAPEPDVVEVQAEPAAALLPVQPPAPLTQPHAGDHMAGSGAFLLPRRATLSSRR